MSKHQDTYTTRHINPKTGLVAEPHSWIINKSLYSGKSIKLLADVGDMVGVENVLGYNRWDRFEVLTKEFFGDTASGKDYCRFTLRDLNTWQQIDGVYVEVQGLWD